MFQFFQKNHSKVEEQLKVVTTNYFKVIEAIEIASIEAPPFNQGQWGSEEDYKVYLESVQPLILEYEQNGKLHTQEEQAVLNRFRESFLDARYWINVEKTLAGEYRVVSNGRHRMYVAKKYGLKLIVHVAQEVR